MSKEFPNQREIFLENGIPEPEDITKKREQKFFQNWIEKEGTQNTPEWEEFLNRIDFNLLRSLFSKMEQSCGIYEGKSNFIGSERILSSEYGGNSYVPKYNVIMLSNSHSELKQSRNNEETSGALDMRHLHTLVHEETHAISKNVCIDWRQLPESENLLKDGEMVETQSGFHRSFIEAKMSPVYTERTLFMMLNEAVVEKIAREIGIEYLIASNLPKEATLYEKEVSYEEEVSLIDSIVKKLSQANQLSKETVWRAFKRSLLEGEKFENQEIIDLFEDVFGGDFLKDLAKSQPQFWGRKRFDEFKKKYNLGN